MHRLGRFAAHAAKAWLSRGQTESRAWHLAWSKTGSPA